MPLTLSAFSLAFSVDDRVRYSTLYLCSLGLPSWAEQWRRWGTVEEVMDGDAILVRWDNGELGLVRADHIRRVAAA